MFLSICCIFIGVIVAGPVSADIPSFVEDLVSKGGYAEAIRLLEECALLKEPGSKEQKELLWEAERLERIRFDYPLSREDVLRQLHERVSDFEDAEFDLWKERGYFDWRLIDGNPRFLYCSVSNLFHRYPKIRKRSLSYGNEAFELCLARIAGSTETANADESNLRGARRFRIRMTLSVEKNAVPDGATLRCWLPFPRECSFQHGVRLLSSTPEVSLIAPPSAPHRSVYLEQTSRSDSKTEFSIEYAYTSIPRRFSINPDRVTGHVPENVQEYVREEPPHLVFLPEFEAILPKIVGSETNPYHIGKRIYTWLSENMRYSYAREYSTIRNISRYTYRHRYGDCGQITLLFMVLCRMSGIPARWESGWVLYPDLVNLHDWCTIYLDPYGWVPVDPNFGVEAMNSWDRLNFQQKRSVREFYFGQMDPYRLVVNSNHGDVFIPAKEHFRSDTVDFQRAEVETSEENIYYDQFTYNVDVLSSEPVDIR